MHASCHAQPLARFDQCHTLQYSRGRLFKLCAPIRRPPPTRCIDLRMQYHSPFLGYTSLVLFVGATLLSAKLAVRQYTEDRQGLYAWWKAPSLLPTCLALSYFCRSLWVLVRGIVDPLKRFDVEEQVINRFAILFYFTGYAFVVALIMDLVRVQTKGFLRTSGRSRTWAVLWQCVALTWFFDFVTTLVWALDRSTFEYNFGLGWIAMLFFVLYEFCQAEHDRVLFHFESFDAGFPHCFVSAL